MRCRLVFALLQHADNIFVVRGATAILRQRTRLKGQHVDVIVSRHRAVWGVDAGGENGTPFLELSTGRSYPTSLRQSRRT